MTTPDAKGEEIKRYCWNDIPCMNFYDQKVFVLASDYDSLRSELATANERIEKLERVMEAAEKQSECVKRLLKIQNWTPDGNHVAIHADGMLDLEGYDHNLYAALAAYKEGK